MQIVIVKMLECLLCPYYQRASGSVCIGGDTSSMLSDNLEKHLR